MTAQQQLVAYKVHTGDFGRQRLYDVAHLVSVERMKMGVVRSLAVAMDAERIGDFLLVGRRDDKRSAGLEL